MDERRTARLLVTVFVVLAAALAIGGVAFYRAQEASVLAAAERQLSAIADLKTGQLVAWRADRVDDAGLFFENPSFAALARRAVATSPADPAARAAVVDWIERERAGDDYDAISLLDVAGTRVFASPAVTTPVPPEIAAAAAEALSGRRIVTVDFYRDAASGRNFIANVVPLFDEAGPIGTLALRMDPSDHLYPFIQTWPVPSETAETLLVRREGDEVVYLNDLRFRSGAALRLRFPLAREEMPAVQGLTGKEGAVTGTDYRGVAVVAHAHRVPGSPWAIVAKIDRSEALAPAQEILWTTLITVAALVGSAAAAIALLWRGRTASHYREQLETERALRRSEALVTRAIDTHVAGMVIVRLADDTFVRANRTFLDLAGLDEAAVIGHTAREIGLFASPTDEGLFDKVREAGRVVEQEVRIATAKGPSRWVLCSAEAFDIDGEPHVFAAMVDITARKRLEWELQKINDGLEATVAERTEELTATNEELTSATEELTATNEELEAVNQELLAANAQAGMTNQDLSDLNERLVLASEEIAEANLAKSQFLANMSHELRTPLNAIIGFSDVMMRGMAGSTNEEQHRQLSMVNEAGKHLLAIINDILDLSRIESGHLDIEMSEVDLAQLGDVALGTVRPLAAQRGLELRLVTPQEPCPVRTDARRVHQILLNLLGNAVKFTERGAVALTIGSAAEDGSVRISVSDTGIGIAPDQLDRVFDEFQQFDSPFLAKPEGTGLGLAVSRRLAAGLGGTLEAASTLGEGSIFTLVLPISVPPPD